MNNSVNAFLWNFFDLFKIAVDLNHNIVSNHASMS